MVNRRCKVPRMSLPEGSAVKNGFESLLEFMVTENGASTSAERILGWENLSSSILPLRPFRFVYAMMGLIYGRCQYCHICHRCSSASTAWCLRQDSVSRVRITFAASQDARAGSTHNLHWPSGLRTSATYPWCFCPLGLILRFVLVWFVFPSCTSSS